MNTRTVLAIPLSVLFAELLSGCPLFGDCGPPHSTEVAELSPEEYAQLKQGMMPGPLTGAPTTGDGSTGSTGSTGDDGTTGGSTTGAGTTGDDTSTTGIGGSTGEPLSDDEACRMVCEARFGGGVDSCTVDEQTDKVVITCNMSYVCKGGRGHACVRPQVAGAGAGAGADWLAQVAHDEAASVYAFRCLARELAAHGAPAELLARIDAAADDEVRHAEITAALARSRGAEIVAPACVPVPARDLLALALENAVEGCVHETWAALAAAHQARRAADPALRAVFAAIAEDEARHAELAWALDAWLLGQLNIEARAEVVAARRSAASSLIARLAAEPDDPELRAIGVPPAAVGVRLASALGELLWAA